MLGINYYGILSLKAKSNLPSISFSLNSYICQYLKAPVAKMNYAVILRKRGPNSAQWESQRLGIMQLSLQARKKADLGVTGPPWDVPFCPPGCFSRLPVALLYLGPGLQLLTHFLGHCF